MPLPNFPPQDPRQQALYHWSTQQLKQAELPWESLTGDASSRRYFRVPVATPYLAVDSPPHAVDNARFIAIAQGLAQAGLHVPNVLAADLENGFLLVNELSTQLYSDILTPENADDLYKDAFSALIQLQNSAPRMQITVEPWVIADYYQELTDMVLWLFETHLNITLSSNETKAFEKLFHSLIKNMQEQPQVCVHRDYHSRNLLYCADNNPGIIDFQDLFSGPFTYDLVSLLRDAYVEWPWERVELWVAQFYQMLTANNQYHDMDFAQFLAWFHGMSLQRGIKVLGRFARLYRRDNKPRYLPDLPRVADYVLAACPYFPGTSVLVDVLNEKVVPKLKT